VKKNRDDLKDLCEEVMTIIEVIEDQLSAHSDTEALRFKGICEKFERLALLHLNFSFLMFIN
jgi:hypothetical protein